MGDDTIRVVPYDPGWPARFQRERAALLEVFAGQAAEVEHVGSTAVPGLWAKPILDVMLGVASLSEIPPRIGDLEALGYQYVPGYEDRMPDRRYFRRPARHPRSHHLHCVVTGGAFWVRHLAFRDHLRSDPETARAYGELKRVLARRYGSDRTGYLEARSDFIAGVLARALPER